MYMLYLQSQYNGYLFSRIDWKGEDTWYNPLVIHPLKILFKIDQQLPRSLLYRCVYPEELYSTSSMHALPAFGHNQNPCLEAKTGDLPHCQAQPRLVGLKLRT